MFFRRLRKLEEEVWKLQNPPEFKVGDIVEGLLVVEVIFFPSCKVNYEGFGRLHQTPRWKYKYYDGINKKVIFSS